ncbi:MAG: class I SAM-dependent methyltransferase [Saprospiraceae bacterium]|nr:class I SAM-dependent methyltransferase [Saprospiraceae bacterium]
MIHTEYKPEKYWSQVAERIEDRESNNVIAGDDEPFYRYKRSEFLKLLSEVDLKNKSVLEVGNGPGGNLSFIMSRPNKPSRIAGADISLNMVNLAKKNTKKPIELFHFDGANLPFEANTFDVIFTATVLQHNTDESMLLI